MRVGHLDDHITTGIHPPCLAKAISVASSEDPLAENSEEFLELANGCLCCSIKDAGIAAIEKLMERKGSFDHIILETTGLADPGENYPCPRCKSGRTPIKTGPIASMFWLNEEYSAGLRRQISLDGVVCVVDAAFGQQVAISINHEKLVL